MNDDFDCDVLVVGGGINGAGIARDAAGRGLSVVLCEKDDLARHTSSASSKLLHGGLRYLEHYEFGLVRKALAEREILLKSAPHIAWPLRFVIPQADGGRPAWLVRAGLFLYDHLARRDFLPGSAGLDLRDDPAGAPLQPRHARGFAYSDAWVDDARLVVLAAVDARMRGASVLTRTRCSAVRRGPAHWQADLEGPDGARRVRARCLVNAAGPWAAQFAHAAGGAARAMRLVRGSHIVVSRLFEGGQAYLLQQPDGRIVFALPYEGAFTLVGTTDVDHAGDLDRVAITPAETAYLCEAMNRSFIRRIAPEDVVWSYAGVRPLVEEGDAGAAAAASRDYRLDYDTAGAPLLSVFGGKVTTFRKLAEQAVDRIAPAFGRALPGWTAHACLPGGDLFGPGPAARAVLEFDGWRAMQRVRYPWLPEGLLARYARAYGTRIDMLLEGCTSLPGLGAEIVPGLFEREAEYMAREEWAVSADDILWRRSKLGLHVPPAGGARLDAWLALRTRERVPG